MSEPALATFWPDEEEREAWLQEEWHVIGSHLCACQDGRHADVDKIADFFRDIDRSGVLSLRIAPDLLECLQDLSTAVRRLQAGQTGSREALDLRLRQATEVIAKARGQS